jgi:hypothetical protein
MGLERPGRGATDEQVAGVVAGLADPLAGTITEIAAQEGVSESVARHLVKKLRERHLALFRAAGATPDKKRTMELYEQVAENILFSIDTDTIKNAGLRDRVIAAATATDKALLLDGQPTEIYSLPQLENLDTLCTLLLQEAHRRGQTPVLNEGDQTVTMRKQIGGGERGDPTRNASAPSDEPS